MQVCTFFVFFVRQGGLRSSSRWAKNSYGHDKMTTNYHMLFHRTRSRFRVSTVAGESVQLFRTFPALQPISVPLIIRNNFLIFFSCISNVQELMFRSHFTSRFCVMKICLCKKLIEIRHYVQFYDS